MKAGWIMERPDYSGTLWYEELTLHLDHFDQPIIGFAHEDNGNLPVGPGQERAMIVQPPLSAGLSALADSLS